ALACVAGVSGTVPAVGTPAVRTASRAIGPASATCASVRKTTRARGPTRIAPQCRTSRSACRTRVRCAGGAREPRAQPLGRIVRSRTVDRRERGGSAWRTGDLRAPAVGADGRDLDRVRAAVDGFFEADDRHGQRPIVVAVRATTSEGTYESASAAA